MDGLHSAQGVASSANVAEYHASIDAEVERAVHALDTMFSELRLQRRARLAGAAAHGREQIEKEKHTQNLARAEAARLAQLDKERLDRERWKRQKEEDEARARDEEQRRKHIEETAQAQKEEAVRKARIEEAKKSADAAESKAQEAAAKAATRAASEERERAKPASTTATSGSSAFGFNAAPKREAPSQPAQSSGQPSVNQATAQPTATSGTAKPNPVSATENQGDRLGTNWKKVDEEFQAGQERINWIRENVKLQLKQQPKEVQDRVRDLQSDLRARFGMLTDSKRKLIEVREVVRSHFQEVKDSGNTVAYMAVLNAYAKLLVSQGEAEAQKTIERALPLAMLTVLLWDEFRDLGDFVIPRFIKKCPQVIGYSCPTNTEEGRKRMGWKRDKETNRYEDEERYAERIAGICSVWSAMTQSKMSTSKEVVHPYPITHSWVFLSRHLNRPKAEATAADYAAVGAWWDMTATRFHEAFGKQAHKLLTLAWDTWTEDRMEFPAMRLRGLGEDWQSTGKLEHAWKPLAP